eukprot:TRINITY_DN9464_c0_g1_i1.p1 TRINITY_DN9464_c0_g1~~TRINITY_DN9464_c0_g1_i1.p1  ORF type:complete len:297 (-),score=57.48 TRINITY_DN9464_c0_g1_i1:25-915(-)
METPPASPNIRRVIPSHIFPSQSTNDWNSMAPRSDAYSLRDSREGIQNPSYRSNYYEGNPMTPSTPSYMGTPSRQPWSPNFMDNGMSPPSTPSRLTLSSSQSSPRHLPSIAPLAQQGPPVRSMYDGDGSSSMDSFSLPVNQSYSSLDNTREESFSHQPPQLVSGNQPYDDRWVTVFGFDPSQRGLVMSHFQKYGDIIRSKIGEGNWIDIQYQTRVQAQKAITKNGKLIDRSLMVGVTPAVAVREQVATAPPRSIGSTEPRYRPAQGAYAVEPLIPKSAPTAYSALWSKVLEYIFNL